MSYIFPSEMFLNGSDLSPLEEHFEEFVGGLTTWEPESTDLGVSEIKTVEYTGSDYLEVYTTVNEMFVRNQWRDSLPIVPPSVELVDWILTGTDLDPDTVISETGGIPPRGGIATVRAIAANLAMAGGRPEYLPFLLAAVKAITNSEAGTSSWNATTASTVPAFVVNGPIAKQIRLASGYGCMGPDPLYPAGQILGRAVRLVLQNLGGALPGSGSMAIYGGMRTANVFFAEDEDGVPGTWSTWAEERGFTREQNVVTFTIVTGMANVYWHFGDKETNDECLRDMAGAMATPIGNRFNHPEYNVVDNPSLCSGIVCLPRSFASSLEEVSGYSKEDVKKFLWDNSMQDYDSIEACGYATYLHKNEIWADAASGDLIPVTPAPEQITIVIAGGDQGGHGYWMQPINQGRVVSCEVELPANWDSLILQSEIDLGPIPAS